MTMMSFTRDTAMIAGPSAAEYFGYGAAPSSGGAKRRVHHKKGYIQLAARGLRLVPWLIVALDSLRGTL